MAIRLQIKAKGLFHRADEFDFQELIKRCDLEYGYSDGFNVLCPNEVKDGQVVVYNPKRIGRGIALDIKYASAGVIKLIVNLPTSPSEIRDMVMIVKEIQRQMKKISIYWEDAKKTLTMEALEEKVDYFIGVSLDGLHDMSNKIETGMMVFMAKRPWYISENKHEQYKTCQTLFDFEQSMHELQKEDIYTATPKVFMNQDNGKLWARYLVLDGISGLYPVNAKAQLNVVMLFQKDKKEIDNGKVIFGNYQEKKLLDGLYDYDKFIQAMKEEGAKLVDAMTIQIPAMSKEHILEIIEQIQ